MWCAHAQVAVGAVAPAPTSASEAVRAVARETARAARDHRTLHHFCVPSPSLVLAAVCMCMCMHMCVAVSSARFVVCAGGRARAIRRCTEAAVTARIRRRILRPIPRSAPPSTAVSLCSPLRRTAVSRELSCFVVAVVCVAVRRWLRRVRQFRWLRRGASVRWIRRSVPQSHAGRKTLCSRPLL